MAKRIDNEEDVEESLEATQKQSGFLTIPEGKTPIYLLSKNYADGYVHWVSTDAGAARVVCLGGLEGKGFAVEECPLCKKTAGLYSKAKKIEKEDGETKEVRKLRALAGRIRAKYEAIFVAAMGELVKERRGDKKVYVPDFDEAEVGLLRFTQKQFDDFTALRKDSRYPFMESGKDLTNRAFILDKGKRGDSKYATTEFIPAKNASDPPEIEWDKEEMNPEKQFEVDEERVNGALEAMSTSSDDDDEVESEEFEDDDLDDGEDDEEKEAKLKAKKKAKEESEDDDEDSDDEDEDSDDDDSFLDDVSEDDDEEEQPKKSTKRPAKKSARRK